MYGEAVSVGGAAWRLRSAVPVQALGDPLDYLGAGTDSTRRDGLGNQFSRGDVPRHPVRHGSKQRMGQVLQRDGQGFGAGIQPVQPQLRRDVLTPSGVSRSAAAAVVNAVGAERQLRGLRRVHGLSPAASMHPVTHVTAMRMFIATP